MKNFDFIGKRRLFAFIALGVLVLGLILNLILGTELDIAFKGGTLLKYSYEGTLEKAPVTEFVQGILPKADVDVVESGESGLKTLSISLASDVDTETQTTFIDKLQKQYPDNKIAEISTNSLQPANGKLFFLKCWAAIILASVFLVIYIGLRFRRIGGFSAGVMSLCALLHDILIAYFAFVIFRIPLNDNFVAVVLTILGYSLNDTIVIYDRIRENRSKMDRRTPIAEIVNVSLNQSFGRTLNTSICTFAAIGTVAVVSLIFKLDAITSFAVPMSIGVVAGFYSSTFLCSPLWVLWVEYSTRRKEARAAKKKAAKKSSKKK